MYRWKKEYQRDDGRFVCCVDGVKQYRSRLVYCNVNNCSLEEIKGFHVHHKDRNVTNDGPENLELLTPLEHAVHHPERAKGPRSKEIRERFSEVQKSLWKSGFYKNRKPRSNSGGSYKYNSSHADSIELMKDLGKTWDYISETMGIARTTVRRLYKKRKEGII